MNNVEFYFPGDTGNTWTISYFPVTLNDMYNRGNTYCTSDFLKHSQCKINIYVVQREYIRLSPTFKYNKITVDMCNRRIT
jgi:hypothetical protein